MGQFQKYSICVAVACRTIHKATVSLFDLTEPNLKCITSVLFGTLQDYECHGSGQAVRSAYDLK